MFSAINTALGGIQTAQRSFLESAQRISRYGTGLESSAAAGPGPEGDMVNLMTSRRGYEANLQVVRAADDMMGTLLDTFA